ncbi:uncharacterized protein BP01DRAFT_378867 [Aspergillus saccharolyticus JOP 1030-1]|uniref:Uncharacterized protein n=1 Tax=Aspergillus saccharolyticus JOP 1030-1 TaxID=1450539 RepID=A0A318ZNX6_9EURO|nr:hypothetical protein BP01DRAFT_378867 [Aspergillus saccharolyticus JOP 1030-1]PYH49299.1 hypothetical protein BP01DRAFT_378867 [Aspergillus saccharolyticus JOP 1030-1]
MPYMIKALVLHILLADAIMSQAVLASPLGDLHLRGTMPVEALREQPDYITDELDNRGKTAPKLATADFPSKSYTCPKTDAYTETTYTSGQLTKAYIDAAKYANEGKQLEKNKYPHNFANHDKLPFECGATKQEFGLNRENPARVYSGGDVKKLPDGLKFEYTGKG